MIVKKPSNYSVDDEIISYLTAEKDKEREYVYSKDQIINADLGRFINYGILRRFNRRDIYTVEDLLKFTEKKLRKKGMKSSEIKTVKAVFSPLNINILPDHEYFTVETKDGIEYFASKSDNAVEGLLGRLYESNISLPKKYNLNTLTKISSRNATFNAPEYASFMEREDSSEITSLGIRKKE